MKKLILIFYFFCSFIQQVAAQPDFEDEVQDANLDSRIIIILTSAIIYGLLMSTNYTIGKNLKIKRKI